MENREEPCMVYGPTALVTGIAAGLLVLARPEVGLLQAFTVYLLTSLIISAGILIYRSDRYGGNTTFTSHELGAFTLSATGFSLLVALAGLLITGISRGEYTGNENWVSDEENIEREIQRLVAELELSEKVEQSAMQLLGNLRDSDLMKNRPVSQMAAAIVYVSGKEANDPRSLEEIAMNSGATRKEIGRAYRFIGRNTDVRIRPPDPMDYLNRYSEKLRLSDDVKSLAGTLIEEARDEDIFSGKSPTGLAASALFLAGYMEGEHRSMNEVSDILDVTPVTVRNRSQDFIRALNLEDVPEHLIEGMEPR
jgi:hypothetical protein